IMAVAAVARARDADRQLAVQPDLVEVVDTGHVGVRVLADRPDRAHPRRDREPEAIAPADAHPRRTGLEADEPRHRLHAGAQVEYAAIGPRQVERGADGDDRVEVVAVLDRHADLAAVRPAAARPERVRDLHAR